MTRYFFDTEFIEDGKTIDLISIGIVAEDGREFYAINDSCKFDKASDWVKENVLSALPPRPAAGTLWEDAQGYLPKVMLAGQMGRFLGCELQIPSAKWALESGSSEPEFWAYYSSYDWVVFCQLFGTMMDLPKGFPMYCRDLKQEADRLGVDLSEMVPQEDEHHALADARWNKRAWEYLQGHEALNQLTAESQAMGLY